MTGASFAVVDARSLAQRFPRLTRSLSGQERQTLVDTLLPLEVQPGQSLQDQGRECAHLYGVWEGELNVTARCRGRELTLGQLGPGQCLGVAELLVPGPAAFTIRATTPSLVLGLDHDTLEALRHHHPRLGSELLRALFQELVERLEGFENLLADQPRPLGEAATARLALTLLKTREAP